MSQMIPCSNPSRCGVSQHHIGTLAAKTCIAPVPGPAASIPPPTPSGATTRGLSGEVQRLHDVIATSLWRDATPDDVASVLVQEHGVWHKDAQAWTPDEDVVERMSNDIADAQTRGVLSRGRHDYLASFLTEKGYEFGASPIPALGRSRHSQQRLWLMSEALMNDEDTQKIAKRMTSLNNTVSSAATQDRLERAVQDRATALGFEDCAHATWAVNIESIGSKS